MSFVTVMFGVGAFIIIRYTINLIHSLKRIDEVHDYNVSLIPSQTYWKDKARHDANDNFIMQLIDIRKWTYKQFFPKRAGEK